MCSLLLKPHPEQDHQPRGWTAPISRFFNGFNYYFDKLSHAYGRFTARAVRIVVIMLCIYGGVLALGGFEFRRTPIGFIPQVDQGYLIVVGQLPGGASISRTDEVMRRAADIVLQVPGVAHVVNVVGFS